MKCHVDRQYLKDVIQPFNALCRCFIFRRHLSGSYPEGKSRDVFLFSLIRKMASEGEAGSAVTTETEPGEGYGSLGWPRFFFRVR